MRDLLLINEGKVEEDQLICVFNLTFQENRLFINTKKSDNRGTPALAAED